MTRIDQLTGFISDDPNDPFPRYALALEYLKDDPSRAKDQFELLLARFPDYLPTYYPAAHLMIELGLHADAERLFILGIEKANQQHERKTAGELKQALEQWRFERSED